MEAETGPLQAKFDLENLKKKKKSLQMEAEEVNRWFFHYLISGKPYIVISEWWHLSMSLTQSLISSSQPKSDDIGDTFYKNEAHISKTLVVLSPNAKISECRS